MLALQKIDEMRRATAEVRRDGRSLGFVPTMGALHAGHVELIRAARKECDVVAASIFVNPIQFGPHEDFRNYPRPLAADLETCRREGVRLVFHPDAEDMYPREQLTTVRVDQLTDTLCGEFRPGHFTGVTTVVAKLFHIVQPDAAYFGQKDAQQALIIRRMIRDLNIPVRLRICPTVREATGLALSSRNQYLNPAESAQAACLYQSLQAARDQVAQGQRSSDVLIQTMQERIEAAGPSRIQYIRVVDPDTLRDVATVERTVLIALAVHIGPARLIDNILLDHHGNEIIMS